MDDIIIMDSFGDIWLCADDGGPWFCRTSVVDGVPAFAPSAEYIETYYGPIRVFQEVK